MRACREHRHRLRRSSHQKSFCHRSSFRRLRHRRSGPRSGSCWPSSKMPSPRCSSMRVPRAAGRAAWCERPSSGSTLGTLIGRSRSRTFAASSISMRPRCAKVWGASLRGRRAWSRCRSAGASSANVTASQCHAHTTAPPQETPKRVTGPPPRVPTSQRVSSAGVGNTCMNGLTSTRLKMPLTT